MGRFDLNHYQHFSPPSSSSKVGLSVASKAGSTLSTGSSEGNMESLVDYHKVDKLIRVHTAHNISIPNSCSTHGFTLNSSSDLFTDSVLYQF